MIYPVRYLAGVATGPGGPINIMPDISQGVTASKPNQRVTINPGFSYLSSYQSGLPTRPFLTGSAMCDVTGLTWPAGAVLTLLYPEAAALIASGAAVSQGDV